MTMAKTSDRISSLAARYAGMSNTKFKELVTSPEAVNELAYDVRSMAGSLLRQDEHRGLRRLIRKVTGL